MLVIGPLKRRLEALFAKMEAREATWSALSTLAYECRHCGEVKLRMHGEPVMIPTGQVPHPFVEYHFDRPCCPACVERIKQAVCGKKGGKAIGG